MNWKLISKNQKNQPTSGTYSDWKEQIAKECFYQCVYCSIHEAQFGGIDHYHIDHFRPKSKFPAHKEDILNLFYACPVCNRFKSDDWPGEPDLNTTTYIDPSKINYSELFDLKTDFEIVGNYTASRYIILRLYLNRSQLIFERRESLQRIQEIVLRESINALIIKIGEFDTKYALEALMSIMGIYSNLLTLEQKKREIRPYQLVDIRRS
jgi:5-methylcytosine-specific restriction endonuclease McrA